MMISVTLPDGSKREYQNGATPMDVALSISEGLARNVLAAKVDGQVVDSNTPLEKSVDLQLLTWNDTEGKSTFWHSSAHLMAEALESLYPGVKFWVGPPVENGFYYDIDTGEKSISSDDFKMIEDKMLELARQKNEFKRIPITKADALKYFGDKGDEYKLDLLSGL
ncbi:MAG: TGS domain-containing protein, partial [Leadbetterella sp.]|nr:TGS domain-containing protein [Leadbetterella sp.]